MTDRPHVALVTSSAAVAVDPDLEPLADALVRAGAAPAVVAWNDTAVTWSTYDAAVLRSTWDYPAHATEFVAWCDATATVTELWNPAATVRWNMDKRYLVGLAAAGIDVVPTTVVDDVAGLPRELLASGAVDVVVKPAVGAGSIDADRHRDAPSARAHVERLLGDGRAALVQPYVGEIEEQGELDLVLIDGRYSHATRKAALLAGEHALVGGLFREERLETAAPDGVTVAFAERVVDQVAARFGTPLYARVDVVHVGSRPHLLELELVEPSLNHAHGPGSADALARAVLARLDR